MASQRLISLDALRGFTIAGMIIVNDPGSWAYVYPPLRHANWHGLTPTDLVFPFFLFIVGVSIALAYGPKLDQGVPPAQLTRKILIRTAKLFGLGMFLWLWPKFDWGGVRIPGVLQRIALVFMVCSFMFLRTNWRTQLRWGVALLLGYWIVMAFIPVPIDAVIQEALASGEVARAGGKAAVEGLRQMGDSWIAGNFEPGTNMQAWLDRRLVPGRLYEYSWDPEGLFSTLPAIASGILGMLMGHLIRHKENDTKLVMQLMLAGAGMLLLGHVWSWFFPFNKNLWSSSFTVYTAGLATLLLGLTYWLVDMKGYTGWTRMGIVFGANAITAYFLHSFLSAGMSWKFGTGDAAWSIKSAFMDLWIWIGVAPEFASLLYALSYTLFIYLFAWLLYRKKIFIKV